MAGGWVKSTVSRLALRVGRAGRPRRTRRKPIHGGSMAPSMAPTVLCNLPARPLTVSVCGQPRRRKEEQEQNPVASLSSTHGVDLPCRPRSTPTKSRTEFRPRADQRSAPTISSRFRPRADQRSTPTKSRTEFRRRADQRSAPTRAESGSAPTHSRGKLSKAGWVRWQGCEPHGCGDQAPMGEGALLAKHCFASARTHSRQRLGRTPEGGLRRPLPPDPPRHPTECRLLTLIRRVQGCKPCR